MLRTQIIRPGNCLRYSLASFCAVIDVGGCCDLFAPGSAVIERFAELIDAAYGLGLIRKLIGRFRSHVLPKSRGMADRSQNEFDK